MRAGRLILIPLLAALVLTLAAAPAGSVQPPLEIYVSAGLVRATAQPVDNTRLLRVCVRGFDMSGHPRLTGLTRRELVPCADHGVMRSTVEGCASACSTGTRRWLTLHTLSHARVLIQEDTILDGKTIVGVQPIIRSCAESQLLCAETCLLPLSDLLARSIVRANFCVTTRRNNRTATEISEQFLAEQVAAELPGRLARANSNYRETILDRLSWLGVSASEMGGSSTAEALFLRAVGSEVPVSSAPPAAEAADARLSFHQDLLNRRWQRELAGQTLTAEDSEKRAKRLADLFKLQVPEKGEDKDLSITLDEKNPVTIRFEGNQAVVVVRGTEYATSDTVYPAMNVTSRWDVVATSKGVRLVRRPQLEIYPPGFVPGSGKRLPLRLQVPRTMLNRHFSRLLPTELDLNNIEKPEVMGSLPEGRFNRATADNGWFVANWNRLP